jgi:hypothetical protein
MLLGCVPGNTVALLDFTRHFDTLAVNLFELMANVPAPLCIHPALELFPVSCNYIPVHIKLLLV